MGFFSSDKGLEEGQKQKINAYNIWILFLLAPSSITYGYTAAIIATTLGMSFCLIQRAVVNVVADRSI